MGSLRHGHAGVRRAAVTIEHPDQVNAGHGARLRFRRALLSQCESAWRAIAVHRLADCGEEVALLSAASHRLGSYALLRIAVILGLLSGIALSPKLWLSSRLYPPTPVWAFLKPPGPPVDYLVLFALVACLILRTAAPRRGLFVRIGIRVAPAACPAGSVALAALVLSVHDHAAGDRAGRLRPPQAGHEHLPPDRGSHLHLERAGKAESELPSLTRSPGW